MTKTNVELTNEIIEGCEELIAVAINSNNGLFAFIGDMDDDGIMMFMKCMKLYSKSLDLMKKQAALSDKIESDLDKINRKLDLLAKAQAK